MEGRGDGLSLRCRKMNKLLGRPELPVDGIDAIDKFEHFGRLR